ncbi:MAG: hypothetical protein Q8918_09800 [Bacteroidota bacterium]|nr:hypothetical protein [Bacteroidota bacterium]MDP4213292.1 hypothetical protein [Bacteroidota bacterium]MDP4250386.1 hypothetical protein [Bacteroidota bacterium]
MRLDLIVHMHSPGFKARVIKVAEFSYTLKDIERWPRNRRFPKNDPEFLKALEDALVYLSEKAKERKNNPDWLYPV